MTRKFASSALDVLNGKKKETEIPVKLTKKIICRYIQKQLFAFLKRLTFFQLRYVRSESASL